LTFDEHQAGRIAARKWTKQRAVRNAEDYRLRVDVQRERQEGDSGKTGTATECPQRGLT